MKDNTPFRKGTHDEKKARVIDLQSQFYAAIDRGIKGKERGAMQRLCTQAWDQYTKSCYQHKMTPAQMDKERDEIITEARETAEVINA